MRLLPVVVLSAGLLAACSSSGPSPSGPSSSGPSSSGRSSSGRSSAGAPSPGPSSAGAPASSPGGPDPSGEPSGPDAPPLSTGAGTSRPPTGATTVPLDPAARALAGMSLAQRVGQLIMVDCPSSGITRATRSAIVDDHVGSVILDGTSRLGVDVTRSVTDALQHLAPRSVGLLVATDQEGGVVQRLQGAGFTTIPSALEQSHWPAAQIRSFTRQWAQQLRAAGVNVDLAPVLDTVPSGGGSNPPIGDLDREYGHDPQQVSEKGNAVVRGLADTGIAATVKHFPGLGRVSGNTDTSSGVRDTTTTADDAYLQPFREAIRNHVPFVMMSTAIYTRIDPDRPAAFSPTVIQGLLRGRLGFRGVVITDDIGTAGQVEYLSPAQRAVRFVAAGGTIVLTVDASIVAEMTRALVDRAHRDAAFRAKVDAAALLVLRAKQDHGLLG